MENSNNENYELATVRLSTGILVGGLDLKEKGCAVFEGVPYALPPVGDNRWRPAQELPDWQGQREALLRTDACMQFSDNDTASIYYHRPETVSEDCLYLNIWTSASYNSIEETFSKSEKRPVMVWLHGGGLVAGSGNCSTYNGSALAKKGVVIISVNYRLGVFGFMSHPELTSESPNKASGNYGITDQIQALKWVRKNITAFGGDPDNITVFGQSAGALCVSYLLASPLSKGLFHKAILQSPYLPPIMDLKVGRYGYLAAEDYGEQLQQSAGVNSVEALRELPAERILKASSGIAFDKVVRDGWVFKEQVMDTFNRNTNHNIPVLVGYNLDEGSHYPFVGIVEPPKDKQDYLRQVEARYGSLTEDFLRLYPENDIYTSTYRSVGHALIGWGAESIARSVAASGNDVFFYRFDHVLPDAEVNGYGAFHASEIPFVFNNIEFSVRDSLPNWPIGNLTEKDIQLADNISDYWVEFARKGKPSVKGLSEWKPYILQEKNYMQFVDGKVISRKNPESGLYELQQKMVEKRKKNNQHWSWLNVGFLSPEIKDNDEELERNMRAWDQAIIKKLNLGDFSGIDTMYDDKYKYHNLGELRACIKGSNGCNLMKAAIAEFREGFSDLNLTNSIFGSGDRAVNHFTIEGTHDGEWLGIPATGNKMRVSGIALVRFENNKLIEEFEFWDEITILKQLGVIKTQSKIYSILELLRGIRCGSVEYKGDEIPSTMHKG